ncbi:MAG TPA: MlaD family protein [Candidatus Dormibacteraeota bacterium]|jgi:phospholipid/cholesterol/gamma-HCH transport system substrate-binding protein
MRFDIRHLAQFVVFALGLTALALYMAMQMNHTGSLFASRYQVRAEFRNSDMLLNDQDVRIHGVQVGKVTGVDATHDGHVIVSMLIDSKQAPLHADASARVRPYTLIGDKYVDVDPGTESARPIPAGGMIPAARTSVPIEISQLLDIIDADTRTKIDYLLQGGGAALRGRGSTVNDLLARLPQLEKTLASTLLVLDSRSRSIDHLLATSDSLLTSLAQNHTRLDAAVNSSARLAGALADDRDVITQTVVQADRSLNLLATAIAGEGSDARQLVADAPALLDELQRFLHLADADVNGVAPETAQIRGLIPQLRSSFSAQDANGYYLRVYDRYDCSSVVSTGGPGAPPCSLPKPAH